MFFNQKELKMAFNINKLTTKSQEAFIAAKQLAKRASEEEIEYAAKEEHCKNCFYRSF